MLPPDWSHVMNGSAISLQMDLGYYGLWGPTQNWTDSSGNVLYPSDLSTEGLMIFHYVVSLFSCLLLTLRRDRVTQCSYHINKNAFQ